MTYQSGYSIDAADYNTYVRGGPFAINANVPNVNVIWGIGFGSRGYGQLGILPSVNTNSLVTAAHWNNLINRINQIRLHQLGEGGWISIPNDPAYGQQIATVSRIPGAITDLYNDRLLAHRNAPDITTIETPVMWFSEASGQITITATWADADQTRYFFNAGGQIRFTFAAQTFVHSPTLRSTEWESIINRLGTVAIASGGSARVGGSGGTLIENNISYYDLENYNQTMYSLGPPLLSYGTYGAGYGGEDSMTIRVRSNGTQGSRSDKGSQITFSIDFEDLAYGGGTDISLKITPSVTVRPPSNLILTTPIANPTISLTSTFGPSSYS